jgi:hypothetical protein
MGFLREFTAFAVAVFASLGMSVVDLESLASKASQLYSTLPSHNKHIVSHVLRQDLLDSFDAFGRSVSSWQSTPTLAWLDPFVSSTLHTDAAIARVLHDRKGDLSEFGLPSMGLFAAAVPPAPPSLLPLAPSSQHVGAKRKQHPGSSAGSSSPPSGGGAARSRLDSRLCAVGEVVFWGGHFVNWSALAAAFTAEHRMPIDGRHKCVLLSNQSSDKAFSSFAPHGASAPTLAVLRTWYDGDKWKAFEISKPPDFR